jgi:hypothetical protein
LGFSRALGEFGATIMVAGAIPGRTRTLAVGIYTLVETGREEAAWSLLLVSALLAFGAIYVSNRLVDQRAGRDRSVDRRHAAAGRIRAERARRRPSVKCSVFSGRRAAARPRCSKRSPASAGPTRRDSHRRRDPVFIGEDNRLSRARARIGYVPQDALLFPNLDVTGNIRYGAKSADIESLSRSSICRRCSIGESDAVRRRKQRVAIAARADDAAVDSVAR